MAHSISTIALIATLLCSTSVAASTTNQTTAPGQPNNPGQPNKPERPDRVTITSLDGTVYERCKITHVEPDGITVMYAKGITKIPFPELPEEYRKEYGYDPKQASEYSRAVARKRAIAWRRRQKRAKYEAAHHKSSAPQKAPSLEQLNTFPEEYVNTRLIFTGCAINQELEKTRFPDLYAITIASPGGELILGSPTKGEDITFVVRKGMAKKMSEDMSGGYIWPDCVVSCTIEERENYYLAVVDGIGIRNRVGEVSTKYVDPK